MTLRAQVILPRNTGVAADVAVNNWSFGHIGQDDSLESIDAITARLKLFYDSIHDVFGANVMLTQATVKVFNMDDPSPGREPTWEGPLNLAANSTNDPAPSQVAICLSFGGPPSDGQPQRRARGRVFLGPVSRNCESAADRDRIDASIIDSIMDNALAILPDTGASGIPHVVFSAKDYTDPDGVVHPKKPSQAADHAHVVDHYWVDNRFDTQRRRAKKATVRDTRFT